MHSSSRDNCFKFDVGKINVWKHGIFQKTKSNFLYISQKDETKSGGQEGSSQTQVIFVKIRQKLTMQKRIFAFSNNPYKKDD